MSTLTVPHPQYLTVPDIQEMLKLGRSAAFDLVKSKGFPRPVRVGSMRRWPLDDVVTYLNDNRW